MSVAGVVALAFVDAIGLIIHPVGSPHSHGQHESEKYEQAAPDARAGLSILLEKQGPAEEWFRRCICSRAAIRKVWMTGAVRSALLSSNTSNLQRRLTISSELAHLKSYS